MTAREALLRIAANGIAQGHAHSVSPADISHFLDQLQKDSPEILVAAGLQQSAAVITGRNPAQSTASFSAGTTASFCRRSSIDLSNSETPRVCKAKQSIQLGLQL